MKEFAYIHEEGKLPEPLDRIPFFESFQDRHLNDILYSSYFIQADPEDEIIREGQEDSRIFILLAGRLEVVKAGEAIAKIEKPGEIFGELAVVSDEKRSASVVARANSLCLVIDQKFLNEIKPEAENPTYYAALYGFISRVLAARLKAATEIIARLEREIEELRAGKD
jgi:CRP-like cAMP-binding protein